MQQHSLFRCGCNVCNRCNGGCSRETFGSAGLLYPRFANLRPAATLTCLATSHGGPIRSGDSPCSRSHPILRNRTPPLPTQASTRRNSTKPLSGRLIII
ncbi:hypothetical protein FHK92_10940 [Pseudomonas brassicacearum subsp. neoaurantiaca]|uniref:Uncharacterized protein n=1 Tax=Pseudomonas brassicacearum subsp. neoaurantiaca TaxID=494916 RepID=A0A7V8UCZ8_9PSED|nr:hypothetical protein [Pseudomonas brassicacearum subsp. neoaurantiaca]